MGLKPIQFHMTKIWTRLTFFLVLMAKIVLLIFYFVKYFHYKSVSDFAMGFKKNILIQTLSYTVLNEWMLFVMLFLKKNDLRYKTIDFFFPLFTSLMYFDLSFYKIMYFQGRYSSDKLIWVFFVCS